MSGGDWKDLYKACDEGDLGLVEFHVKNGADVNYQHPEILMSLLVTAIKNGHTDIAVYLLRHGADPLLESHFDQLTPIQAALKYKNQAVLAELNSFGVRPTWLQKILSKL